MSFNLSDPAIIAAVKQLKAYMDSTNPTEAARIYAEKKAQFGFSDSDFNQVVSDSTTTPTSVTAPINTTTAAPPTSAVNPAFDYQALGLTPSYSTTGSVETGDLQQTLGGYSKDNGNGTFTQYDVNGNLVSNNTPYSSIGQLAGSGLSTLAKTAAPIAAAALVGGGLAGAGLLSGAGAGVDYGLTSGLGAASGGTAAGTGVAGGLTAGSGGLGLTTGGGLGLTAGGLTAGTGALAAGTTGSLGTGLTTGSSGLGLTAGGGTGLTAGGTGLLTSGAVGTGAVDYGLTSGLGNLGTGLTSGLGNIGTGLTSGLGALDYGLTSGLNGVNTGIANGFYGLNTGLTGGLTGINTGLTSGLGNIGSGLTSGLGAVDYSLSSGLGGLNTGLTSGLGSIGTGLNSGLGSIGSGLTSGLGAVDYSLTSGLGGLNTGLTSGLGNLGTGLTSGLSGLGTGITSGLGGLGSTLTSGLSGLNTGLGSIGTNLLTGLSQIAGSQISANDARNLQNDQIAANKATLEANQAYADKQTKAAQDYAAKINQENINRALTVQQVSNDSINALTPLQQAAYAAQANATKTGLLSDAQLGNTAAKYATEASNQYAKGLNDVALNASSVNNLYAGNYNTGLNAAAKTSADLMKFKPVGVTNRYGSSNASYDANGNLTNVGYNLSPEMKAQQDALMGVSNNMLSQYQGAQAATAGMGQGANSMFNLGNQYLASTPQAQAQKWMADQQALLAAGRESTLSSIQNKLAQQGRLGVSVGGASGQNATNPEMAAYMNAIQQQDLGLAANATQAGQQYAQFGANLVNQGGTTLQNMYGIQNAAYSPYATAMGGVNNIEGYGQNLMNQSLDIGKINTAANTNAANQLYNGAFSGLGSVYNTGVAGQNNMMTAANTGLNTQYQNALNPAQYQEYLNYQRQGIGDQYLAQLQSGNAQAAYNTGSTLQQQQAGYANKFAGTAANTLTGSSVNAPFAQNTILQQTAPNYGGLLGSIGNNLATGNNTGVAGLLSSGLNKVSNWWGS